MTRRLSASPSSVIAALVVVASCTAATPAAAQTLQQHIELSVRLLETSVTEWRERAALLNAPGITAGARSKGLASIERKYKDVRTRTYRNYRTDEKTHLAFLASHAADVAETLDDFPDVKSYVDGLTSELRALIEQAEHKGGPSGGAR